MGPAPYSRFGYSMVAMDINHDGIDDLIVSAPAFGKGGATDIGDYYPKDYNGRLYAYLGQKGVGLPNKPSFEIHAGRIEDDVFFNLGMNLRAGDCNLDGKKDLIVLSPLSQQGGDKKGHVAVVLDIMNKLNQTTNIVYLEDAEVVLTGHDNYQWFGYDGLCTNDGTLVVSSPGKRTPL